MWETLPRVAGNAEGNGAVSALGAYGKDTGTEHIEWTNSGGMVKGKGGPGK